MVKMIELFAGIGGFRLGFEKAGGFETVFSNDSDENCKKTYDYNFNDKLYLKDIRKLNCNIIPDFDVLTAGFPCQSFSIAGLQKGFDDKERGNLFYEIARILRVKRPKCFLLENVKNLISHGKDKDSDNDSDRGPTFDIIYEILSKVLGYHVKYKILNSSKYGNIPQNRERLYIVGFLDENIFKKFEFPKKVELSKTLKDCFEKSVDEKYYYNNKPLYEKIKNEVIDKNAIYQYRRTGVRKNKTGVCPTLTANMGTGGHNVPIIIDDLGIRKLTPRECFNFQGFPSDYKIPKIANGQLYKQIGNSITVTVIEKIAKQIRKVLN